MFYSNLTHSLSMIVIALSLVACGAPSSTPQKQTDAPKATSENSNTPNVQVEAKPVENKVVTENQALLKRGKIVWFKCRSCHETSVDGRHKVGPNLNGVFGATAGEKEGFVYSDAMKNSAIVWDAATLDAFIKKPTDLVKGTKMAFVGISKENDRQALLKYLEQETTAQKTD